MLEAQVKAREIRARLWRPPNAVPDLGIDLKRLPRGAVLSEKKLVAFHRMMEKEPYREEVQLSLMPLLEFAPTFMAVLNLVADYFDMGIKDLMGLSRRGHHSYARHIAFYLVGKHAGLPCNKIARKFHRHHTSVMYGRDKIAGLVRAGGLTAETVRELEKRLAK